MYYLAGLRFDYVDVALRGTRDDVVAIGGKDGKCC